MKTFESKRDCPPVEAFMWDKVAKDFGEFGGIDELDVTDLFYLKALLETQIRQVVEAKL